MKLGIRDRIVIQTFFPKQSDIITLTLVKSIKDKTQIPEKEAKEIQLKRIPVGGEFKLHWDDKNEKPHEVEFTVPEIEMLKNEIEKLDKLKHLDLEQLDLINKLNEYKPQEKVEDRIGK